MSVPVQKLIKEIQGAHEAAISAATEAVKHVLKCGRLLATLKAASPDWERELDKICLSRTTAWRYMKVASDAAKSPAKTRYLLEQGASLVDLYRAFELVKPCQPGGYKSDVYQRRKLGDQLELDFSYDEAVPHLDALISASNVEGLSESTKRRLLEKTEAASERLRESLKDNSAIQLTSDHQP